MCDTYIPTEGGDLLLSVPETVCECLSDDIMVVQHHQLEVAVCLRETDISVENGIKLALLEDLARRLLARHDRGVEGHIHGCSECVARDHLRPFLAGQNLPQSTVADALEEDKGETEEGSEDAKEVMVDLVPLLNEEEGEEPSEKHEEEANDTRAGALLDAVAVEGDGEEYDEGCREKDNHGSQEGPDDLVTRRGHPALVQPAVSILREEPSHKQHDRWNLGEKRKKKYGCVRERKREKKGGEPMRRV